MLFVVSCTQHVLYWCSLSVWHYLVVVVVNVCVGECVSYFSLCAFVRLFFFFLNTETQLSCFVQGKK